jgi:hypothetical protein
MENQQKGGPALKFREIPLNRWKSSDRALEDCRNLVRVLARKTEILYWECRFDQDKARQIRTMVSTLADLTVLVNRLDQEYRNTIPDVLRDSRGFAYKAVRSCDLDRICDK